MKKFSQVLIITFLCLFVFSACANSNSSEENVWKDASYIDDIELGTGDTVVTIDVVAKGKTVSFTINTNKENLGDILMEHNLVSGENGPYGLYIKKVNGILADYDINGAYWALTKNNEYMSTGVDSVKVSNGDKYELTYTES